MMPGKMNPRQLQQMMKRFGINIKTVENVEKVLIQTDTKEYIFDDAEVTIMDAQGQKTFQIAGTPVIRNREDDKISEDIQLIMDQTGKTEKEARNALTATNGDIAEAILKLTEE